LAGFVRYWLPFTICLAVMFTLSGMSSPPMPFNIDSNSLHYPEFAVFSFLLLRAIHGGKPGVPSAASGIAAFLLSGLWGLSDEIHQAFIPGRVPDISDLGHDLIGAACGLAAFYMAAFYLNRKKARGGNEDG